MIRDALVKSFACAALSPDPDLAVAALMIARLEYPKLDAGPYLDQLDTIGREARRRVADATPDRSPNAPHGVDVDAHARVLALNEYLFGELRFVGNDLHYEDPRNSFLNDVLDRRTGIPITLAVIYIEVARRAGVHVEGINFPGHFLVRLPVQRGLRYSKDLIIDAHRGGAILSEAACRSLFREHVGRDADEDLFESRMFAHATKPQIMSRMLLNLKRLYVRMHSYPQARDVTELMLALDPSAINELRDRGLLAYQLNDFSAALRDLEKYLRLASSGSPDTDAREEQSEIWEHVKTLRKRVAALN